MSLLLSLHVLLFLFTDPPTTTIYTSCHPLSLHDALPICTLKLEAGMPYNPAGYYYSTSPPVIAAGKIIVGGAVNDNYSTQSQSGVIRAYDVNTRSEEHTSELQSLMRISYAVFCLKKNKKQKSLYINIDNNLLTDYN